MGRPLYILSATLAALALLSLVLSFTTGAQSPGDAALWRTSSIVLFGAALVASLAGTMTTLFAQAERRHEEQEQARRQQRRKRS